MKTITSDKEFIKALSVVHGMPLNDLTDIVIRFGLIELFDDLNKWDSLEEYDKYLKQLSKDMKSCAGNCPKGLIQELFEKKEKLVENHKKSNNKYYHRNKATINKVARKTYAQIAEEKREYSREYRKKNKERMNSQERERYQRNKEKNK